MTTIFIQTLSLFAVVVSFCVCANPKDDWYREELKISELSDSHVFFQFQFIIQSEIHNCKQEKTITLPNQHYNLFPRNLGTLMHSQNITESHVSFTNGRWFSSLWGIPAMSGSSGAEMWAWFETSDDAATDTDSKWESFATQMGGTLCASLEQMNNESTVTPRLGFRPTFSKKGDLEQQFDVRYSQLPREAVCTENLTPWLKLLPCRGHSGLGAFLKPHKLFNVDFYSMSTETRRLCSDQQCTLDVLELVQTIGVVLDRKGSNRIDLKSIFGLPQYPHNCPVADQTIISFKTLQSTSWQTYSLQSLPPALALSDNPTKQVPPIEIERYLVGFGTEYGTMSVSITNNDPQKPQTISYFEMVPFFLRIYYHTLKITLNDDYYDSTILEELILTPSEWMKSPALLEFKISVPPKTKLELSYQFEKAHLHWTEYVSDANRGWDVPPASIFLEDTNEPKRITRIVTDDMLVRISNPDFSMPYNVITLTGTAFGLFFSTMYHLLIRKFKNEQRLPNGTFGSNKFIARLLRLVISFFQEEQEVDPAYLEDQKTREQKAQKSNDEDQKARTKARTLKIVILLGALFAGYTLDLIPEIRLE